MKSNLNRFWTIVILLGWLFDFLFWKKPLGVNFAIFVALSLATGILLLRVDGLRLAPRSGLLLVPIAFLAAMTFIRLEPMTMFLSVCMVHPSRRRRWGTGSRMARGAFLTRGACDPPGDQDGDRRRAETAHRGHESPWRFSSAPGTRSRSQQFRDLTLPAPSCTD